MDNIFDVIVIGGGASGMMAAAIASRNKKVLLIEKNKTLGNKLKISGGGRCNITNYQLNTGLFLKNFSNAAKYLYSPFSQFGVEDTFSFFENLGLPLVVEESGRAFPKTQKAEDVYLALLKEMRKNRVSIKTNCTVQSIEKEENRISYINTSLGRFKAKSFILSTGGISHPTTGSTGDGFNWLKRLGHSIKSPTVTIVPLRIKEKWVHNLSGVSIKAKVSFYTNGKKAFSKNGPILFTHFGLSGPTILNSASEVNSLLQGSKVYGSIDLFPEFDNKMLDIKLLKIFEANKKKKLRNILKEFLPNGMLLSVFDLLPNIDYEVEASALKKEDRKMIVNTLKDMKFTVTGLMGKDRAVAADGGLILDEVDTKTMRSKLYDNLFVTGDILNINRPSGGYSLQLCWTSGYVAGINS